MTNDSDDFPQPSAPEPSPRGPLLALVVIAALIAGGVWLMHALSGSSATQDCVMSGRSNCAPIEK